MPEQFREEMGAIRIYSWGVDTRHRGEEPEDPNAEWDWRKTTDSPQPQCKWKRIRASKFRYKKDKLAWFFGRLSLAQVVSCGIPEAINPVLIIVHMYETGTWDQATVCRQADVIEAAKSKKLPIFEVQKEIAQVDPSKRKQLPNDLLKAVKDYSQLFYYAEINLGNALEGKNVLDGRTLREALQNRGTKVAIVFGQTYGRQCVDSTILGMYFQDRQRYSYSPGLLDIGIDVVTARNVLEPPGGAETPYFSFDMLKDICLDEPSPPTASATRNTALTFPRSAPTGYPAQPSREAATDL